MKNSFGFLVLVLASSTAYAQGPGRQYNLVPIAIGLFALYLFTYGLTKTKHLSLAGQRKIWNILLTISFAVVGLTGLLTTLRLDLRWNVSLPDSFFWHVEFGLAMIVIAVFHALWHWRYYLALIKKK